MKIYEKRKGKNPKNKSIIRLDIRHSKLVQLLHSSIICASNE